MAAAAAVWRRCGGDNDDEIQEQRCGEAVEAIPLLFLPKCGGGVGRAGVVGKDPRNNMPLSFLVTLVGIYNYDNRFNPLLLLLLQPLLLPPPTNYQLYSFDVSVVHAPMIHANSAHSV
jgi:hypothetical protein